jgi:hypothetical protein
MSSDVDQCIAYLEIKLAAKHEEAEVVLDKHVDKVYDLSRNTYCPVDTAALRESAKKTKIENGWRISFGGESFALAAAFQRHHLAPTGNQSQSIINTAGVGRQVDYAINVHENLSVRHDNPSTACAKFLERAVTETNNELFQSMRVVA